MRYIIFLILIVCASCTNNSYKLRRVSLEVSNKDTLHLNMYCTKDVRVVQQGNVWELEVFNNGGNNLIFYTPIKVINVSD